jgi:hypothetical protein
VRRTASAGSAISHTERRFSGQIHPFILIECAVSVKIGTLKPSVERDQGFHSGRSIRLRSPGFRDQKNEYRQCISGGIVQNAETPIYQREGPLRMEFVHNSLLTS